MTNEKEWRSIVENVDTVLPMEKQDNSIVKISYNIWCKCGHYQRNIDPNGYDWDTILEQCDDCKNNKQ